MGVTVSVERAAISASEASSGNPAKTVESTMPRSTIQRPVWASETRTSQLPPSLARRANASMAPKAIKYPLT